jgi:hypothetical protein
LRLRAQKKINFSKVKYNLNVSILLIIIKYNKIINNY